jgi:pimeloyl-ACP methyl ester carboxylesterase
MAKQRKERLTGQQKQVILISLKKAIDQFKSQRWFRIVAPGNILQRMVSLDVDRFFSLLTSDRYAQDWDRSLAEIAKIRCPVLAIWGQEDSFLPPNQSAMRGKVHSEIDSQLVDKAGFFILRY